jgi:pimeloyl-ACP methyl ester carboxylesterase
MKRSILKWRILDDELVGTYHIPEPRSEGLTAHRRLGVLLLNSGTAPRSGNSDLSAQIGSRLSSNGIPVFRFDLPGLGDSTGSIPPQFNTYWHEVLQGRNDAATLGLIKKIKHDFGLNNLIVGGLCGATAPTLRVADAHPGLIASVILMEPEFYLGVDNAADYGVSGESSNWPSRLKTKSLRLFSIRYWLTFLTGSNHIATALLPLRPLLIRAQLLLVGHTLHMRMNVPLFMNWKNIHARGAKSLVIVAKGLGTDRDVSYALASLPPKTLGQVTLVKITGTNHIFSRGEARDIVLNAIEMWGMTECRFTDSNHK